MQYISKMCPHCKKAYSVLQPKGTGFYGSPIRKCENCGKSFVDRDFREIAAQGVRKVDTRRLSLATVFSSCGFLVMGICAIGMYINGESLLFSGQSVWTLVLGAISIIIALYLCISEIRGYNERQEYLAEERKRSEERLSNYQYARLLDELAFYVPPKYLNPESENRQ